MIPPPLRTFTVTFIGSERDDMGMPMPFHRYTIVVGAIGGHGGAALHVATVESISGGPMPTSRHFPSQTSEQDAIEKACAALAASNPMLRRVG